MKKFSSATAWVIVFILVILAALLLLRTDNNSVSITFNDFQKDWLNNDIKSFLPIFRK